MPHGCMWLVATIMDSVVREHVHHFRKFYWTVMTQESELLRSNKL